MQTILTAILSATGTALFALLLTKSKAIRCHTDAIKSLTHDRLFTECQTLLKQDYITIEQLENLEQLWKSYSGMGMNGTGEALYNKCKELEIR